MNNIQVIIDRTKRINLSLSLGLFNKNNNKINDINNLIDETNNTSIPKIRNIFLDENKLFEPIGILDPMGLKENPLTNEPYRSEIYEKLGKIWSQFPMYAKREESIKAIYHNQVILIISGTGSGKTVLAPKFALHAFNYQGRIAITNPKRTPTKKNAEFAADCLDVTLGTYVGMKYRDSDPKAYSSDSKLIYATDGWILQKLQKDPMLSDLDMVIIDEAHERGIQIDLLLLLLKELLLKRPNFKLIIMSATINSKIFIDYFPKDTFKFKMIDAGEVPNYPIEEVFLTKPINKFDTLGNLIGDSYIEHAVDKVVELLRKHEVGDILVFFPGKGNTSDGCMLLHRKLERLNKTLDKKIYCNVLTSTTDDDTIKLLTHPDKFKESGVYTRKVIFATEVAESSITFYGLDFVIDTGLVNNNIFYSEKNLTALEKKYISKASHKQRKGRTGRTGPGTCFNLFTKEEYEKTFIEYPITPISTEDISVPLMYFLSRTNLVSHLNIPLTYKNSVSNYETPMELSSYLNRLIEIPPLETVKNTIDRLIALDIINVEKNIGKITDLGRAIATFEMIPEIGRMLISGYNHHCKDDIVTCAVLMDLIDYRMDSVFEKFRPSSKENEVKKREKKIYDKVKSKWINSMGDHFSLINIYNEFYLYRYDTIDRRSNKIIKVKKGDARKWCKDNFIHYNTMEKVKEAGRQIHQKFGKVIQIFREKNPNEKPTHIFTKMAPKISDKHNENIIKAIMDGFYINLIKKNGSNKYENCFPNKTTIANLSQESLFARVKSPTKYAIYSQLKSIFGKTNYSVILKVPPAMIDDLKKSNENKYIKKCFSKDEHKKHSH